MAPTSPAAVMMARPMQMPPVEIEIPALSAGERLVLTCDRSLSAEQLARLKIAWERACTGPHKTIVLDAGFSIHVLPANPSTLNGDYSARFGDTA
jgi:hypothetical protein